MILEIDAGNSSLKWRWRASPASSTAANTSPAASAGDLAELEAALGGASAPRPREVLICNVRGADFEAEVSRWLKGKWNLPPRFARVAREAGGLRIQYPNPADLGADRWLAMLAGFRLADGACLIVDSGTALTIDLIDSSGLHLGGYIMPGLKGLRAELLRGTAIRLPLAPENPATAPGNDTAAAVRNGALFMLCAAVRAAIVDWQQARGEKPPLILTGGDAPLLRRELKDENPLHEPELVLDGLALMENSIR